MQTTRIHLWYTIPFVKYLATFETLPVPPPINNLLTSLVTFLLIASGSHATLRTWNNAWDVTPVTGDDVIIEAGDLTWDASLPSNIASFVQSASYTDTVTFATFFPGQGVPEALTITGDCTLNNGAWTHTHDFNLEKYRISVSVGGNLLVESNATIDADEKGFSWNGPGSCGHGGLSVYADDVTYGSITAPTNFGAGIYVAYGGGAIRLDVTGNTTVDGTITTQGRYNGDVNQCGGAGGSIFLTTDTLLGSGSLNANGGGGSNRSGGGGRIAVILKNGTNFGNVVTTAYGGTAGNRASAGTVYKETSTDTPGKGELIIDNDGLATGYTITTDLNGQQSVTHEFARLTLGDAGVLGIGSDDTLILTNTVITAVGTAGETGVTPTGNGGAYTINDENGIRVYGGTLLIPDPFVFSNYFISIADTNSTFDAPSGLTVGQHGKLEINSTHTLSGDVTLQTNSSLTHYRNTEDPVYLMDVTVSGNLTIDLGAEVNVDQLGYRRTRGPGGGSGSHGGQNNAAVGATYGSVATPVTMGSGGGSSAGDGGGVAKLTVAGTTTLDGVMTSNGGSNGDVHQTPAAGGSIWLTTSNLTGSGTIRANGGAPNRAGGGGRVAVTLTGSDSFGNVDIQAYGGDNADSDGGAGTVYLRKQDQSVSNGVLLIRNMPGAVSSSYTLLSSSMSNAMVGAVLIEDTGRLRLGPAARIQVSRTWSNGNVFVSDSGSEMELVQADTFNFHGNSTFATLTSTNANKPLQFSAGSTNGVTEFATILGNAGTDVTLRSIQNGASWHLELDPATVATFRYVDVKDSDASPGATAVAIDSENMGNNSNWIFTVGGIINTWQGPSNTEWSVGANWDVGHAPTPFDSQTVIANGAFDPLLPSDQTLNGLEVQAGAVLGLNGFDLTVNGDTEVDGTLDPASNEVIKLYGNVDFTGGTFDREETTTWLLGTNGQSVTSDTERFYTLIISNDGRTVTFTDLIQAELIRNESVNLAFSDGLTATHWRNYSTKAAHSLTFGAGSTTTIRDLFLLGEAGNIITLASDNPGVQWTLAALRRPCVRYVSVRDSDAGGGMTVFPLSSTDVANNDNWDFAANVLVWHGATSATFSDGTNWMPNTAPDNTTRIFIDGNYTNAPTVSSNLTVREIMIGCDRPSVMTIHSNLTVAENIWVLGYGELVANVPVMITSNLTILDGGVVTHDGDQTVAKDKLDLTIGGNLTVDTGGAIDVDEKGYRRNFGPGVAGAHGGQNSGGGGTTYGSITEPNTLGSGGGVSAGVGGGSPRGVPRAVTPEIRHPQNGNALYVFKLP